MSSPLPGHGVEGNWEDTGLIWRADVIVMNGNLHYGPWTNRQRVLLQSFFFPFPYRNLTIDSPPQIGEQRKHPAFDVSLTFEGTNNLRVPTREPSKDWKFLENASDEILGETKSKDVRPYGWIDIKIKQGGSIHWKLPMISDYNGYVTTLSIALTEIEIFTSVNYSILLSSEKIEV